MALSLVGEEDDPSEARVIADLATVAGLASPGRIASRLGMPTARVEAVLRDLIRKGKVRTCRYTDGVFYELIPMKEG